MPLNDNISIPRNTWTLLTAANVTALTFQVQNSTPVRIKATVGAVAPTDLDGSIIYDESEGEISVSLADMFPGVSGANRVYAYAFQRSSVAVSYA